MTFSKSSSCLFEGAAFGLFILVTAATAASATVASASATLTAASRSAVESAGLFTAVAALTAATTSPVPAAYPIPNPRGPKGPKVLFWF